MQPLGTLFSLVRPRRYESFVIALAVALAGACAASAWFVSGKHFMLPLDDSYIHLQYARQLAKLEVFSYTPGADPSGGATSPLWVMLLAPFFVMGMKGVMGAIAAFALGTTIWVASAVLIGRITNRATECATAGFAASLLFLLNGHLLWNFVNGMETGLFAFLVLAAVHSYAEWERGRLRFHLRRLLIALALLPICRPEGFLLSGAALGVLAIRDGKIFPRPLYLGVFLPGFVWLGALKLLTGEWKPSGLLAKGLMERSDIGLATKLQIMAETLVAIPTRFYANIIPDDGYALFKGTDYMPYLPAGLAFVALLTGVVLAAEDWRERRIRATTFALAIWLVGLLSLSISGLPFIHQQRYLVPWTPLIIVLAVVGIWRAAARLKAPSGSAFAACSTFMLLSIPSVAFWGIEFGRNASDIYHQHRVMSFSVAQDERIAVTDTGVLAYYTDAAVLDFVGLTSARYTRSFSAGESALLELIGTDWEPWRPSSIITYRHWFSPDFPLGPPLHGAYIENPSIVAGQYLARYEIDWERIDIGRSISLLPGETRVEDVNVASLAAEKNSNYKWSMNRDDERRGVWPRPNMPVATARNGGVAGGRFVRTENFDVRPEEGLDPSTFVLIARVARSRPDASPPAFARVLELTATSLDSGVGASMQFEIPDHIPGAIAEPRIPIGDLLDRAGGKRWRFSLRAVDPQGDAWLSFNYVIISRKE